MKIIRGLQNLKKHNGCAVTIGNFDGVHIAHQQIINRLVDKANELNVPAVLISFSPSPQQFFGDKQAVLNNFKEKYKLFAELGINEHLLIKFNAKFSKLKATDFIEKILINKLNTKYCLIGDDFRFGKNRDGDFKLLQKYKFKIENTTSIIHNKQRISSSKIRKLLAISDFKTAAKILGREFSITGKIIHGSQKGRTIGFPTINIPIKRKISPILGVFAVIVTIKNSTYQGVCNIGKRPTVGGEQSLLEVFLFDFNKKVYDKCAKVVFKHKIRDEQKFSSFSALKEQIKSDALAARKYFHDLKKDC